MPRSLQQQIADQEARLARLKAEARRLDDREETRRKILLGAAVLLHLADLPLLDRLALEAALHARLVRPGDRRLFGLAPLPEVGQGQEAVPREHGPPSEVQPAPPAADLTPSRKTRGAGASDPDDRPDLPFGP